MCKKSKSKKGPAQQQQGGYKRFLHDLQQVLNSIGKEHCLFEVSNKSKHQMYMYHWAITSPVAGNEYATAQELKIISDKNKKYYKEQSLQSDGCSMSNYQLQLLFCYLSAIKSGLSKRPAIEDEKVLDELNVQSDNLLENIFCRYQIDYFRTITQLSSPDHKYYGVSIIPSLNKNNPRLNLNTKIYGIPANKIMVEVNGYRRPAFQLGIPSNETPFKWISLDTSLLAGFYKGNQKELKVYMQSHALNRLRERLDILDTETINYTLWENIAELDQFMVYGKYLILPFKVFDVKIGYLVANVIDDKLLFRTFLFITHNCTPEGDRLKKLTGLSKVDITYWHIDRLSTFVKLNEEKYPGLIKLFSKAGLGDLLKLKDKEFNIDNMQAANLDGLAEYLKLGAPKEREWNLLFDEKHAVPDRINIAC